MRFTPARLLALAIVLATGMTGYYFGVFIPRARSARIQQQRAGGYFYGGDLYPLWLTSRQLTESRANPYTDATTHAIQIGVYGRTLDPTRPGDPPPRYRAYSYPLSANLLAWPLSLFSFRLVQGVLSFLFPLLAIVGALLWLRALDVRVSPSLLAVFLLLYLTSYPVLEGLFALQPTIVVATLLAAAGWALARDRYWFAGGVLALAAIKPQLTVLLTTWLVMWALSNWRRRRGFVFGLAACSAALIGASEVVLPGWIGLWLHALLEYRHYTLPPLLPLVLGPKIGLLVALALLVLAIAWGWRSRNASASDAAFWLMLSFVLAVTVLALPMGDAIYEHILLVPGLLVIYLHRGQLFQPRGPRRWLAVLFVGVLFWQWFAACGLMIAGSVTPGILANSSAILLPLRLAVPLPFLVVALVGLLIMSRLSQPAVPVTPPST